MLSIYLVRFEGFNHKRKHDLFHICVKNNDNTGLACVDEAFMNFHSVYLCKKKLKRAIGKRFDSCVTVNYAITMLINSTLDIE